MFSKTNRNITDVVCFSCLLLIVVFFSGCGGRSNTISQSPLMPGQVANTVNDSARRVNAEKVSNTVYALRITGGNGVGSFMVKLAYDSSQVKIKDVQCAGLVDGAQMAYKDDGKGNVLIAIAIPTSIKRDGLIANVTVKPLVDFPASDAVRVDSYELTDVEGKVLVGNLPRNVGRTALAEQGSELATNQACDYVCGDLNGDGRASAGDATLILRSAVDLDTPGFDQQCSGDVAPQDAPDRYLKAADATLVLRKAVSLTTFGCGTPGTFVAATTSPDSFQMYSAVGQSVVPNQVLVLYSETATADNKDAIVAANQLTVVGRNSVTGMYQYEVPSGSNLTTMINSLKASPYVADAEANVIGDIVLTPNDPSWSSTDNRWGYEKILAHTAWDITQGSSDAIIAILDTGIDPTHPEFSGRIVQGFDFVNNDTDPRDDHGHGTHVAGIAAAKGNNGIGMTGVCWECKIMPIKVANSQGGADLAQFVNGVTWATSRGAKVISASLRWFQSPGTLERKAIQDARNKGVVVVVAAGNESKDACSYTPAGVTEAFTVGSTTSADARSSFSNYGSCVDIAAPGSSIYSTLPTYDTSIGTKNYGAMSGTSMATPFVSGLAGLIFSKNPSLTPAQVESYIQSNGTSISTDQPIGKRINAYATLNAVSGGSGADPTVALSASKTSGAAPLKIDFTATCTVSGGSCTSFMWNFGDYSNSSTSSDKASYTYRNPGTYTAKVIGMTSGGKKGTASVTITVTAPDNPPSITSFTALPTSGVAPLSVNFTCIATDENTSTLKWLWNFGDTSQSATGQNTASYTFKNAGTYTVKCRVVDSGGQSDEKSTTITVTSGGNQAPLATCLASPSSGNAPLTVTFTGHARDADGSISDLWWNFGDSSGRVSGRWAAIDITAATQSVTQQPSHTYNTAGTYTATVTAFDNNNASGQATCQVIVR